MLRRATVLVVVLALLVSTFSPAVAIAGDGSGAADVSVSGGAVSQVGGNGSDAGPPVYKDPKIGSALLQAAQGSGGGAFSATNSQGGTTLDVLVVAGSGRGATVANAVAGQGGTVTGRHGDLVDAEIPASALSALANNPAVEFVRAPPVSEPTAVTSEGLSNMNVVEAHNQGYDGEGVNVTVIDKEAFNLQNPEIAGNVERFKTLGVGSIGNGTTGAHGTAVTELVVDTAPNATVNVVRYDGYTNYLNAIDWIAQNTDTDVVVVSISWFNVGPMDGDSYINQRIGSEIVANDTAWVNSAGNYAGGQHWNGTFSDPDGNGWMNFSSGGELERVIVPSGSSGPQLALQWNASSPTAWYNSAEDYDLYVYNSTANFPNNPEYVSTSPQNGAGTWAAEAVSGSSSPDTYYFAIKNNGTSGDADFDAFTSKNVIPNYTNARSVTNPANGADVIAVGALDHSDDSLESFSSRGPTIDGRTKPDLVAPDNVTTSSYSGLFRGTSASAPHAGGVAALVVQANDSLSPAQLGTTLTSTADAVPFPASSVGAGAVNATAAIDAVEASGGSGGSGPGGPDTTPPTIHNTTAIDVTDGDDTVGDGDTVEVRANVSDAGGVATVSTATGSFGGPSLLNLTQVSGPFYNATFQVDGANASVNGDYNVTVRAFDAAGNSATVRANALTLDIPGNDFTVHSKDVTYVSGPGVSQTPNLTVEYSGGMVQVQLRSSPNGPYNLENVNADTNTTFRINATINGTTPRVLLGAGNDLNWTRTRNENGSWTVSITTRPAETQGRFPAPSQWDGTVQANTRFNATVQLAFGSLNVLPQQRRQQLNGSVFGTDAQSFGQPTYNSTTNAVSVSVEAPHFAVSGANNTGFFDALLPDALLNSWGVSSASQLSVNALGSTAQPASATNTPAGIRLYVPIHYSSGQVTISPGQSNQPTIANATVTDADGDGVVESDGETVTVSANVTDGDGTIGSVTFDGPGIATPVAMGQVGSTDGYRGQVAVDESVAPDDGTYRATITAEDDDGNVTTAETNAVELDLRYPPEDEVVNASAGVDVWQRSIFPLRADPTGAAIQLDNAFWNLELNTQVNLPGGSKSLNKKQVGIYDVNSAIPLTFDDDRAVADHDLAGANVQLVAARLEGNQSATLASISTLQDVRELLTSENANTNASFELVDSTQLNNGGDASFSYTPGEPGQYVLLVATNESGGLAVDGNGNVSVAGQTTVVGVDAVSVRRPGSTATPDQGAYASGDTVNVSVDTTGVVHTQPGNNTTHAVVLYDEATFVNQTFTVNVSGQISSSFNVSENVTLEHSIATVNGVGENVGNASAFGVTVEGRRASGLVAFQSVLDFIAENTSVSNSLVPKTTATGNTVWNASMTVKNGSGTDTIAVDTRADWPRGEYRWLHLATNENGTEFAANTGTIEINESATPANVVYSNLSITPAEGEQANVTERATATLDVENTGGSAGSYDVTLLVDGTAVDWANGSIASGGSLGPTLTHTFTSTGTYNLTLVANGKSVTSNVTAVVPDTTPPAITLVSPAPGRTPYGTPVAVNVTDSGGVSSAYATVDGSVQDISAGPNPRTITTAGIVKEGTRTITVNATDAAGNEITKTFTFDFASPPTVTSVSPTGTVGQANPWINVIYADDRHGANETGVNPAATKLSIDGQAVTATPAVSNATELRVRAGRNLSSGSHTARLTIVDDAGHATTRSWKFSVDAAAPSVSIASSRTAISALRPTTISVTANDDNLNLTRVEVWNSSGKQGTIKDVTAAARSTSGPIQLTYDGGSLADGTYKLVVVADDSSGNAAQANTSAVFVDNTRPVVTGRPTVGNGTTSVFGTNTTLTNGPISMTVDGTDATTSVASASFSVRRKSTGASANISGQFPLGTKTSGSLSSLASGQYQIRVTLTDDAGNVRTRTLSPTIRLDKTSPGVSATITRKDSTTLWVNVTSDETLSGAPSASLGNASGTLSSVAFQVGGQQSTYNGTVPSPSANGQYDVSVTATDLAGNQGTETATTNITRVSGDKGDQLTIINQQTGSFMVVNLSAKVTQELVTISDSGQTGFSLPAGAAATKFAGFEFNNSAIENVTVGIKATPENKPSWAAFDEVTINFWNATTTQWEAVTPTNYTQNYDIPNYDGQFDNAAYWTANRTHLSPHGSIANDTEPPSVTFNQPTSDPFEYDADNETVQIDADLTDDETGVNESTIEVLVNGTADTGNATVVNETGGNFSVTYNVTGLSPGDHRNVTINASDFAGNQTSETINFSVADDDAAPSVTIDDPPEGHPFPIGTRNVSLNVSYDDGPAGSGVDNGSVTVFRNASDLTGAANVTASTLNVTATGLGPGDYNFSVNVSDRAGNSAVEVVNFSIQADTTAPTVTVDDVDSGGPLPANTTEQTVTATVNDTGVGVDDTTVRVLFDGIDVTSNATISQPQNGNLTVSYDSDGLRWDNQYNLTVFANDTSDNRGNDTELFDVANDTTKPTITIVSPSNNSVANTTTKPGGTATATINVSLADDASGIDTGGTSLVFNGSGVAATVTTDSVVYTTGALSPGSYSYNVSTRDNATNTNFTVGSFTIATDTTAPSANVTGPSEADTDETVTFDASGSTDNGVIANYTWNFGDGSANATTTSATTTHSFSTAGTYTVTVTVTDASGNNDSATHSITISTPSSSTGPSPGGGGGGGLSTPRPDQPSTQTSGSARVTAGSQDGVLTANIRNAAGGDQVRIRQSDATIADGLDREGAALEELDIDFAGETDFDLEVTASSGKPDPNVPDPPVTAAGYLNVQHAASDEAIGQVRFTFRVSRERLEQLGVATDDVVLYRYSGGEWTALATEFLGTADGALRFRSTSPGLSVFAIGSRETGVTTTTTTTEVTTTTAPPTTTPTTTAPPTATTVEEPGGFDFTPIVVVGLIVVAILGYLYYRRREE